MPNIPPRLKPLVYLLLVVFIFLSSFLTTVIIGKLILSENRISLSENPSQVGSFTPPREDDNTVNILLLGYGGAGHDGGGLADAISIIHIDPDHSKAAIISLPRDIWVPLPIRSDISQNFKINHAFAIGNDDRNYPLKEPLYKSENGGVNMAKVAVKTVTNLDIDYYVSVDFNSFVNLIDTLGGVTVSVPVTFDDHFYPIKGEENNPCDFSPEEIAHLSATLSGFELEKQFECRYEHLHFDAGTTQMDGATALKFVRSRHSDAHGGDYARHQRQQAVLYALKDKLVSINALSKIDQVYADLSHLVSTNLDVASVKSFIKSFPNFQNFTVKNIYLNEDNAFNSTRTSDGQFALIPREGENIWQAIHQLIQKELTNP